MPKPTTHQIEIDFSSGAEIPEFGTYRYNFSNFYKEGSAQPTDNDAVQHLSNLIDHWVTLPKYCVPAKIQNRQRNADGNLPSVVKAIKLGGREGTMTIRPARLEDPKTGKEKEYYPTQTDEIIESILIKLFTHPDKGVYPEMSINKAQGLVRFRLRDICRVLEDNGVTRRRADIKKSLYVMAGATYVIKLGHGPAITDRIITSMIEGSTDRFWTVRLSMMVSGAIAANAYRQYPFSSYMQLRSPVAQWILTRMSMQTNFGKDRPHRFRMSDTVEFGLLNSADPRANIRQIRIGISELSTKGLIDEYHAHMDLERRIRKNGRTVDMEFTIRCNDYMLGHVKAANARKRDTAVFDRHNATIPKALS